MTTPIRIALFVCDDTNPTFVSKFGDIPTLFNNLLTETAPPGLTDPYIMDSYAVRDGQFPANVDDYNAILLSGSGDSVYEESEWIINLGDYIQDVAANHPFIKLFGICFGHQLISHAVYGEIVAPNPKGWELGPFHVELNTVGRILYIQTGAGDNLFMEEAHHDIVFSDALSTRLRSIPRSRNNGRTLQFKPYLWGHTRHTHDQGSVCGAEKDLMEGTQNATEADSADDLYARARIFTSQSHPEVTKPMEDELIRETEAAGSITSVEADVARARNATETPLDSDKMGTVIWRVLLGHVSMC